MAYEPVGPAVILVVYEEAIIARVVTRFLRHLGYTVLETTSEVQALGIVRRRHPPIDLILSDSRPQSAGETWLQAAVAAEASPPQQVLLVDRLSRAIERVDGLGRRSRVIRKPLDLDELEPLLRAMLPALLPLEECENAHPGGPTPG